LDCALELLLVLLVIGVNDPNEQLDTGRERRRAILNQSSCIVLQLKLSLLADDKCDCVEQALPARDCFNDEILADNCLCS
jgi:hypothetical protein